MYTINACYTLVRTKTETVGMLRYTKYIWSEAKGTDIHLWVYIVSRDWMFLLINYFNYFHTCYDLFKFNKQVGSELLPFLPGFILSSPETCS